MAALLLDGRDMAGYLQERHARQVASLPHVPRLAIITSHADEATLRYLRAKKRYGEDIGANVVVIETAEPDEAARTTRADGIIIQLPLAKPETTDSVLASVSLDQDIDGLASGSMFEPATVKAIRWLLAAYDVPTVGVRVAVVGQGRLVGAPLSDILEAGGSQVSRCDIHTTDLASVTLGAGIIVMATGQKGLLTSSMVAPGTVVVDAGSPASELSDDLRARTDIRLTPNPGGVGPMTVACLFDNLLIAAERSQLT